MNFNKRSDIPKEYTWDLTTRYKTDEEWEKEYNSLKKTLKKIKEYEGKLLDNVDTLFNNLEFYFKMTCKLEKLYVYSSLKYDENLDDNKYNLMFSKALSLYVKFMEYASFIVPEIISGKETTINKYLKDKKLSKYKFFLENLLRDKEHTLSKSEEEIITKLSNNSSVYSKINSTLTDSTLDYGTIIVDGELTTITNSNYRSIMMNKDINIRKECYLKVSNKLHEFDNIFASSLVSAMKEENNIANIKHYKNALDMELFSSNIPSKVVDNLFKTVNSRLDVFQNYLKLVKKGLGLNELHFYDLNAELLNSKYTFDISDVEPLLTSAFSIYGEEYNNIIKKAFKERWIDFGSYRGKKSGAYSTSNYGNNPVVLTNFHGKFTDVSAVAHELGHAVNFYLSAKNNNYHESENDIFVAEVASLTNEIILSDYIMKNSKDKKLKLIAIYNLIDIIQNNLFDACLEAELENRVYKMLDKDEEVNADILGNAIYDIRKEYYGNTVKLDDNVKYMWTRRAHYFYPYYLFKYATGVSAAIYVATHIISNKDNMKEKYLEFLGKGETNYPTELLKEIGIDMTKPNVINNAIDYFDYLVNEFNKEAGE